MTERRLASRCPVCSGPTIVDPNQATGVRCRNSSCRHNHPEMACPRCQAKDLAQVTFHDGNWQFTCAACEYKWQKT